MALPVSFFGLWRGKPLTARRAWRYRAQLRYILRFLTKLRLREADNQGKREKWEVLSRCDETTNRVRWVMHDSLARALEQLGLVGKEDR